MFTKTSSFFYQKYGDTYLSTPKDSYGYITNQYSFRNKHVNYVFHNDEDIFICVDEGIAILCVSTENNADKFEQFVIHHTVRLKKNHYFNFLSISDKSQITISYTDESVISCEPIKGFEIRVDQLLPKITIDEILVYYYQLYKEHQPLRLMLFNRFFRSLPSQASNPSISEYKNNTPEGVCCFYGRDDRIRTCGLCVPNTL